MSLWTVLLAAGSGTRLARGDHAGLDAEIQPIIRTVLHAPAEAVEQAIEAAPNAAFIRQHLRAAGF